MRQLRVLVAAAAAAVALATALPAAAHEPWDDGSIPPPPPASAADGYSKDMHLLSTASHTGGVNSDLAFKGTLAFAGHYGGFRVIDLAEPGAPVELADVHCNGPQGDVTVHGDLLFLSVDTPQSTEGCEGSTNVTATTRRRLRGRPRLRHQRPGRPAVHQGCAHRLRLPHEHARPRGGRHRVRLRRVVPAVSQRDRAGLPAALRAHLGDPGRRQGRRGRCRGARRQRADHQGHRPVRRRPGRHAVLRLPRHHGARAEEDRRGRLPLAGSAVGHLGPAAPGRHGRHRHA